MEEWNEEREADREREREREREIEMKKGRLSKAVDVRVSLGKAPIVSDRERGRRTDKVLEKQEKELTVPQ